jgi:[ribosomal protein S18]-alanine N-acetyltransferase
MIRPFEKKDAPAVYTINKTSHPNPEPNVSLLIQIEGPLAQTWVAEMDGRIVGFLVSRQTITGPNTNQCAFNIYNVAVDAQFRRKGIASELIKGFEDYYKGQGYAYLHVDRDNPAQKLYFDLGYRVYDIIPGFYGDRTFALKMYKSL